MEQQASRPNHQPTRTHIDPPRGAGENVEQIQQVYDAAQQLIKKVLSANNSQAFVAATIQGGGE
jgi:hypothetical protein